MKPRLLFIISDLGPGGAQPMNVRLARQLQNRGWPVRLVTLFKRPWFEPLDATGLDVVRLNAQGVEKPLVALRLVPLARQADVVIGGEDDAATNYGWLAARVTGKPFIAWTHIAFHEHIKELGPIDRWLTYTVRRRVRWTVFPSHGALSSLRQLLGKQPQGANWMVIENFLDPLPSPNRPLKKYPSNAPVTLLSKKRAAQTWLRSDCDVHFGRFAGRFAHFGRTYPSTHA